MPTQEVRSSMEKQGKYAKNKIWWTHARTHGRTNARTEARRE